MLISIGILAWNEELSIERTLRSLLLQNAFSQPADYLPDVHWEIIVVPNGCTDRTTAVTQRALEQLVVDRSRVAWRICEITDSGKSNAWNQFVHQFSDKRAEFLVFLDADIEFREEETLLLTVNTLRNNPHADAAVDLPLKDALKKPKRSFIERLSLMSSNPAAEIALTGQFFCARTAAMRRIWMPRGLPVEDGFLGTMIATSCMLHSADPYKIIRAEGAAHYYETLTSLTAVFRHELRLVIGTSMNCYLLWDFLIFATDPNGPGAGILLRNHLDRDPDWYRRLMTNSIRNHGWWVLPRGMLFRRFKRLFGERRVPPLKKIAVAIVGLLLDLPIFLVANHKLKNGNTLGYW